MKIKVYCGDIEEGDGVLEELEKTVAEVQNYINLVEKYGYEDLEGNQYDFDVAQVEYNDTLFIYVKPITE